MQRAKEGELGPLSTATHASATLTSSWKLSSGLEKLQRIKKKSSSINLNMKNNNVCYYCMLMLQLEKAKAPHYSTLAWKIPWTEEPGALQSMGSRRVELD